MSLIDVQLARRHTFKTADEVEDKAITIRPSSTALFCVDSSDRFKSVQDSLNPNSSPYAFLIYKNQSLLNGFFSRIGLTEIVFPYYIPNINNDTNTLVYSFDGAANQTITVPNGFYNPDELATELQTLLQAQHASITVTYTYAGTFLIDAGATHTIEIFDTTTLPNAISLFRLLGGTDNWETVPIQVQSGRITRCRYTEFIDIVCTQLTYNQDLKDGSSDPVQRDILARVYLEAENDQPIPIYDLSGNFTKAIDTIPGTYPFTIYRQFKTPKMIKWEKTQPLGNLQFEIYDSRGNLLSLHDTVNDNYAPDWRFTLLVSEN